MAEVKFSRTVKYNGVKYQPHETFVVADTDIDALVADGAIVTVAPQMEPPAAEVKPLQAMTVPELNHFAAENSIELGGTTKKADILATILAELEAREEAEFEGGGEGTQPPADAEGATPAE